MGGWRVYMWSETIWAFFSQETIWVQMKFGGRRFKVVFKALETLGILAEFQGVFLLKFLVSFLAIFLGLDLLFSGQWCSIYRKSFMCLKMSSSANIMY